MSVTRAVTVVLTEEEWRAFLRLEPQPVLWLRERIQERLRADAAERGSDRVASA